MSAGSSSVRALRIVGKIITGRVLLDLINVGRAYLRVVHVALRVLVEMSQDPYEAIRHAYLVETETPESPHTVASPTSQPDSTPPTCHAKDSVDSDTPGARSTPLDFTTPLSPDHPLTHASPTLVPILPMSDSTFRKRFRSSYESLPSSSPPDLPSRKLSRGTSKLVEDEEVEDEEEEDEEEEDKEVEESSDFDSESEDAGDEGPAAGDEGPAAGDEGPATGDEGLAAGDEGPGMGVENLGLKRDAAVPEGQQRAARVVETAVGEPLGLSYGALRRREIELGEDRMPSVFETQNGRAYIDVPAYPPPTPPVLTPPSLEWLSGSLSISPAPFIVPSPISSPMIPLTILSHVASPVMAETEGFLTELGAQVEMQGGLVRDHTVRLGELSPALFERYDRDIWELFTRSGVVRDEIFSQRYRFRNLEHEQERVAVTFVAIWRPVLALESWAGQTDAQREALWHAISITQMENQELGLQIAKERRARLDLAEIVDSMRRGQEPRGDV
ncbi:hypothetical protein Tco_0898431 [Tanacetum coccineum]